MYSLAFDGRNVGNENAFEWAMAENFYLYIESHCESYYIQNVWDSISNLNSVSAQTINMIWAKR